MRRLYEIDLLRILAALSVVVFHYTFSGWMQGAVPVAFPGLGQVTRYGYLGVDLFFVISGFVVLMSAWDRRPRQFVASRIVRLYPAYWVAVTLTALLSVISGKYAVSLWQWIVNLSMLNPVADVANIDVVYWTLWAEIRFYALVFVLTVVGLRRRRALLFLWAWLALTALTEFGVLPSGVDLAVQSTFSHYFIAGMALFLGYRFGFTWEPAAIVGLALANAIYRGLRFAAAVGDRYQTGFRPAVIVGVIAVIFGAMILVATRTTEGLGRPWYAVAGALTYPLYLIHAYIGFIVIGWLSGIPKWILLPGMVTAMCLAAWVIHAYVERPLAPRLKALLGRIPQPSGLDRAGVPPQ